VTLRRKLTVLADAAKYDASCASGGKAGSSDDPVRMGVCHSYTPDGRCVSLLKLLLTNHCIYDCQYCVNRISSDVPRARLTVEEVVWLTLEFHRRNYIEGLFLSSGIIKSADHTMSELVEVARVLREEHQFRGYIHLKTIPGAEAELIEQAAKYADRVSANVELPSQRDLDRLAPDKKLIDAEAIMRTVRARREYDQKTFAPAGQSTQKIVGATASPDAEILSLSERLYREHGLARVYYTAYSPIPHADGRLPAAAPPLVREHRIYQADFLVRRYGFTAA
jgi:putative DNA modification/repair radical SAM protein